MDPAATTLARALKRVKGHVALAAISVCRRLPIVFFRNAVQFGQSLEYSLWVIRKFGTDTVFFATRERLWHRMLSCLRQDSQVSVLEFGVAYGYTPKWWLPRCTLINKWYGFDTFTGLPCAWRHFAVGAFDADGRPPALSDPRIEWIVGRIEDTVSASRIEATCSTEKARTQRVFIFDLDLYEPTRHAAEFVFPRLQEGDILYFEEAADWVERRVLLEEMPKASKPLMLIGATPMALAMQVGPLPEQAGTPASGYPS